MYPTGWRKCEYETCPWVWKPKKDEPITAEWLESVGGHLEIDECYYFEIDTISLSTSHRLDNPIKVYIHTMRGWHMLDHIKTRQQFRELYLRLSGRELAE
jgi:hypothetical protein